MFTQTHRGSAYHPQTGGASERMIKMVSQCLRFHVELNQKGKVRALMFAADEEVDEEWST